MQCKIFTKSCIVIVTAVLISIGCSTCCIYYISSKNIKTSRLRCKCCACKKYEMPWKPLAEPFFRAFFIAYFIMKKGYWNNLKTPELNTKIIFLRKCALYCPAVLSKSKGYYCQIITIIKILWHWATQNDSWFAAIDKNSFDCRNGAGGLPLI